MAGMIGMGRGRSGSATNGGGTMGAVSTVLRSLPGELGTRGAMLSDRMGEIRSTMGGARGKPPLTMIGDLVRTSMGRRNRQ